MWALLRLQHKHRPLSNNHATLNPPQEKNLRTSTQYQYPTKNTKGRREQDEKDDNCDTRFGSWGLGGP